MTDETYLEVGVGDALHAQGVAGQLDDLLDSAGPLADDSRGRVFLEDIIDQLLQHFHLLLLARLGVLDNTCNGR